MTSTNNHPDHLTAPVLAGIERSVSAEIAATVVTTGYLDGSARQRRDLRILARRLNGIAAVHGVTLEQAIAQTQQEDRPIVVVLDVADVVVPVAVESADEAPAAIEQATPVAAPAEAASTVAAPLAVVSAPVQASGKSQRSGRKARRVAARAAARVAVTMGRVA